MRAGLAHALHFPLVVTCEKSARRWPNTGGAVVALLRSWLRVECELFLRFLSLKADSVVIAACVRLAAESAEGGPSPQPLTFGCAIRVISSCGVDAHALQATQVIFLLMSGFIFSSK